MRFLIIQPHPFAPPWQEGVTNLARTAAEYLERNGEEVFVASMSGISRGSGPNGEFDLQHKDTSKIAGKVHFLKMVFTAAKLLQPDVTLMFSSSGSLLGFKTWLIHKLWCKKLVVIITGLNKQTLGYRFLMRADKILVGSPFLQRYFPDAQIIYPFVPIHLRAQGSAFGQNNFKKSSATARTFLFLGRWEEGRGLDDLLAAASIVQKSIPIKLIVALNAFSKPDRQGLALTIRRLELEQTVELHGIVDISKVYQDTDVVVIPRKSPYRMAFPVRIVEALMMQKPLIVTQMCEMHLLIEDCGLSVRAGDPRSLAMAMKRIATDDEFYKRCVAKCSALAEKYNSERSLEKLYLELKNV